MAATILALLKTMLLNSLRMLVTKKVASLVLRLYVKQTDNLIDDTVLDLGDAALANDTEKFMAAIEALHVEYFKYKNKSNSLGEDDGTEHD